MSLVWADRVLETTTTIGTGALTLAGAVTGYQTFAVVGDGNTCYYCVYAVDSSGNPSGVWEVGLGTYTASGTTLARTTVYANSSGTQVALDLAAGTKRVMLTAAAQHLTTIPVVNGGTGLTALGSALQVLRVNAGGTALEYGTLSTGLTVGTTAITSGTSGRLLYDNGGTLGETAAVTYATSTANLTVTASGAAVVPAVFKGAVSQTANVLECQDSAGAVVAVVTSTGRIGACTAPASNVSLHVKMNNTQGFVVSNGDSSGVQTWFGFTTGNGPVGSGTDEYTNYYKDTSGWIWNTGKGGGGTTRRMRWAVDDVTAFVINTDRRVGVGNVLTPGAQLHVDAGTAATVGAIVRGAASQTAVLFQLQGQSSTTAREQGDIDTAWADSTDATRKARVLLRAWDTAARECIRLEASGSAAMLGLYGTAAVAQYATTGTVTGYTGGGGTALTHSDTFTGNTGATAYTIGDIVRALKLLGAIAS